MGQEQQNSGDERRSEPRNAAGPYHSVEINLGGVVPIYKFNLRDVSENGVCILVNERSPILEHLSVGQVLDLKYYVQDQFKNNTVSRLKSKIRHITPGKPGDNEGHVRVGIRIVEKSDRTRG